MNHVAEGSLQAVLVAVADCNIFCPGQIELKQHAVEVVIVVENPSVWPGKSARSVIRSGCGSSDVPAGDGPDGRSCVPVLEQNPDCSLESIRSLRALESRVCMTMVGGGPDARLPPNSGGLPPLSLQLIALLFPGGSLKPIELREFLQRASD
jgi:hypothetical protein